MLLSLSYIFLFGLFFSWLCKKGQLPGLMGMLFVGIFLGPYCFNLIDSSILNISSELRKIALIIILLRAGLNLDVRDLKKVGVPAILMCFVPACFEMIGMVLLAPRFLGVSYLEAALMGSVVAAVSPAVIVPKMLQLMNEGYGTKQSIPQLILAGASVDDVFVIVMFSAFISMYQGHGLSWTNFITIPVSIFLGIVVGALIGKIVAIYLEKVSMQDTVKVLIVLSISFILSTLEDRTPIPFSGLIAIMTMGIFLQRNLCAVSKRLSRKFDKLWVGAEIVLFVLVGACVNVSYALKAGPTAIVLIFAVLVFRMMGVFVCLLKTSLTNKERLFCMIAYCPKATVQAAIGGVLLAMGFACGQMILTVAVLSILITAPLGAFLIEHTYKKFLKKETEIEN